jgi:hypothetical protein
VAEPNTQEEGIGELLTRLAEDGKGFARAEIAYYRTLATSKLAEAQTGLILGVTALVIALSALTALLVGLILTLETLVGPGLATLIVILAALAVAGLLGWLAYRHFRRMFEAKR